MNLCLDTCQPPSIYEQLASHHPLASAMFCNIWNSHVAIELAPKYLTFPLSTTSFKAFMISFLGVFRSNLWICRTSIYVPNLFTLASTASKMCLRLRPTALTISPSFTDMAAILGCPPVVSTPWLVSTRVMIEGVGKRSA